MSQPVGRFEQIIDSIKTFLLPTGTKRFKKLELDIANYYEPDIKILERDRNTLKYLVAASRSKRMDVLDKLRRTLPPEAVDDKETSRSVLDISLDENTRISTLKPDVAHLTTDQEDLLKDYLEHVKMTRSLREHFDEFDKNLEDFRHTVNTQAVAELTNYRGISDWGETMRTYVSAYATGLGTLSIAGAGLVYSTIFGSNQGAGLMSLTFPLFTVGFLVPGFVYIGTCFAANVPREMTFASQRFWSAAMVFALTVASLMVIGAIVIVNITIFDLHGNSKTHGRFTLAEIAGIISLIFSGTVIFVAFMAFLLGLVSRKMRISLKAYYKRVTAKEKQALNTYHHV